MRSESDSRLVWLYWRVLGVPLRTFPRLLLHQPRHQFRVVQVVSPSPKPNELNSLRSSPLEPQRSRLPTLRVLHHHHPPSLPSPHHHHHHHRKTRQQVLLGLDRPRRVWTCPPSSPFSTLYPLFFGPRFNVFPSVERPDTERERQRGLRWICCNRAACIFATRPKVGWSTIISGT